jgi:shikimate kinase
VRAQRHLVLVGLMGSGKSTVGRVVAQKAGLPFVDSDQVIEEEAGMAISDLFAREGEAAFRDREEKVLARILGGESCVLATGGGAVERDQNRSAWTRSGFVVYLKAGLETLLFRLRKSRNRPLLQQGDPRTILEGLLQRREPYYAAADLTVRVDGREIDELAEEIWSAYQRAGERTGR